MDSELRHACFETPFGPLHVFADADGVVRASGFRSEPEIAAALPASLARKGWLEAELPGIAAVIAAWLAGDGDILATVSVQQQGGPFQQAAWEALRHVPGGAVASYGEIAADAGKPRAARAVGTACASNAVSPFVPCHRVINAGGALGSYGFGGPAMKAAMIAMERGIEGASAVALFAGADAGTKVPTWESAS